MKAAKTKQKQKDKIVKLTALYIVVLLFAFFPTLFTAMSGFFLFLAFISLID